MTMKQQVARFYHGLNPPLNSQLEAMRPTDLEDTLLRAQPLSKSLSKTYGTGNNMILYENRVREYDQQQQAQDQGHAKATNVP